MRRVKEIMIPVEQYPSVRDNATLREAIAKIEEAQLEVELRKSLPRSLLVFDEIDVLVGTVRRRDIMRGLEPKYLLSKPLEYKKKLFDIDVDPNLAELSYDRVVRGIREQSNRPVSDVMQPIPAILDAEDHVMKAVQAMVALDVNLIPVLREGKLVGVVRSVDAFHDLAQLVR
ncbi:MAG: CBS domain-containing protein [Gemmatimonadota bacterium]|nr:MAG: CBS domain-containing protein [Gemmatimonadota bacterium]